ncbi:hypothetical protein EW146_g218 [Bondarzewia mesenterica]|uniref:Major facilitator superfamily (MFS) profile domain-containing protein n=1 Tax=Bondarzewia mesenterica TaxID=1095465 RepID=A0A4S4M9Y1_9AGAM|nr:hypothetical protein EW146_g218 [Bondarzewia mesenterica]
MAPSNEHEHLHHDYERTFEVDIDPHVVDSEIDTATAAVEHHHVHPYLHTSPIPAYRTTSRRSASTAVGRADTDLEKGEVKSEVGKDEVEIEIDEKNLVQWAEDDPENPRNFSKVKKWSACLRAFCVYITLTVSSLCLAVALGSAIITGDMKGPAEELHMSQIVGNLAVTLFVVGFGLGPLIYAPMSEMFGRRPIYIISMGLYTIFIIPSAVAKNTATLLVGRALAGLAASAPMTNVGGRYVNAVRSVKHKKLTYAPPYVEWYLDEALTHMHGFFHEEERGTPMALFSAVIFIGPVLGPLIGGFVGETIGWRWIYYVLLIFVGFTWALTFTVPETFSVVLLRHRAERLRKETGNSDLRSASEIAESDITLSSRVQVALIRPFEMLCTEPILIFMSLYLSLVYMLLYLFFFAFPIVFQGLHHFNDGITGLMFLSILVGIICALLTMKYWNGLYARLYPTCGPESRLPPMMAGCILLPVSLFIFAWTSYEHVSWVGPMMSGLPFGTAMVLIYISANAYIIDSFPKYVASAIAAKTFLRSMAGAAVPMFAIQMYNGMNPRWASTLLALVSVVMMFIPFVFYKCVSHHHSPCYGAVN